MWQKWTELENDGFRSTDLLISENAYHMNWQHSEGDHLEEGLHHPQDILVR